MELTKKQQIVNRIKDAGYNNRQVSVRENSCSTEWSFTITIRDPKVDYRKVQKIIQKSKSFDRDAASGEILMGGNTYVWLEISDAVKVIWAEQYLPLVKAAMEQASEGKYINIDDRFMISRAQGRHNTFQIYDEKTHHSFPQLYPERPEYIAIDLHIANENKNELVVAE